MTQIHQLRLASRLVHAESETEARQRQVAQARLKPIVNPSNHFGRYSVITHTPRLTSK